MHEQLGNSLRPLPVPFEFQSHQVRTAIDEIGRTWWWAVDVYGAISVKWSGAGISLRNMPSDWFCTLNLRGQRGSGDVVLLSEQGVYRVLMRSNSPVSDQFCDFLAGELLPTLRKQGFYGTVTGADRVRLSVQLRNNLKQLETADAFGRELLLCDIRALCNMLGYRMPDVALIGQDPAQLALPILGNK